MMISNFARSSFCAFLAALVVGCALLVAPSLSSQSRSGWGFRTMPISVPGHADHRFRVDGDHDSWMMPITRSGMIPIS